MHEIAFADATRVPALGQGTWRMGEKGSDRTAEARALQLGLDLGMTLIDTAEMYSDGGSEEVVGAAIAGRRDEVFLVSKAYPQNATRAGLARACAGSLRRLGTDRLDLYLLHWRGAVPLVETIAGFDDLRRAGKILRWGVSNLDVDDMAELQAISGGAACAANQVLYNPEHRGIEFDLMGWCAARHMPIMAYSPVGQGGRLLRHAALREVAARHGTTPAQVAIAWALRPGLIVIPKAADLGHVRENAAAGALVLSEADRAAIDRAFPPPTRPAPLAIL